MKTKENERSFAVTEKTKYGEKSLHNSCLNLLSNTEKKQRASDSFQADRQSFSIISVLVLIFLLLSSLSVRSNESLRESSIVENPLIPMGAITGKPTREKMRKILSDYRSVGITQYLIYPRAGCEIEYMSEEWLETCQWICEEAQQLGFTSIWLYDEFNWPSGTCNKEVMKVNPSFEMPQLCVYKENDEYKVVIRRNPQMSYLMDPDAVDCFIKMTHEKYYAKLGKYFGTLIKGIFTDEPDIGFFDRSHKEDLFRMGYYEGLKEDYAKATGGGDLFKDIAAGVKDKTKAFAPVCNRLLGERFRKVYIDRVNQWCKDHRIVFTGHMMNESNVSRAHSSNGHALLPLGGMSFPGIDEIFTHYRFNPDENRVKKFGSIEWLTLSSGMYAIEKQGNRGGLAELFALGSADLSFTRLIKQIYFTAAFGIDHYLLAVAPVDARGNSTKTRYYSSFTTDQPYFPAWKTWGKIAGRAAQIARKDRDCDIAVRYPYSDADLPSFLKELAGYQCSWRVLLPGEKADPDTKWIFELTPQGIHEEKSNLNVDCFKTFYDRYIVESARTKTLVVNKDGTLADEIFLRRFKDGSALAIDFSGSKRLLFWRRSGLDTPFVLEADGIAELPAWTVRIDRPNVARLEFDAKNSCSEFQLAEPVEDLRLVVRQYGEEVEIELDGKKITASDPCSVLPAGFNDLYKEKKLSPTPGKRQVKVTNKASDYPFLPSVFLAGTFAKETDSNTIFRYRNDGKGLSGYSGTLTQTAQVHIPKDALRVSIPIFSGDAELQIDGKTQGVLITAPYRWIVPESVRGKSVKIAVIRHSTIAPLFGKIREKGVWLERDSERSIPGIVDLVWE